MYKSVNDGKDFFLKRDDSILHQLLQTQLQTQIERRLFFMTKFGIQIEAEKQIKFLWRPIWREVYLRDHSDSESK